MAGTKAKKTKLPPRSPNPIHRREYAAFLRVIRRMRADAELTIRDLAERTGKPRTWVHKCETGQRRMDVPEFLEWCEACGVSFAEAAKRLKAI